MDPSLCGLSVGNTRFKDIAFADDAAVHAESLDVLVIVLEKVRKMQSPWDSRLPGPRP